MPKKRGLLSPKKSSLSHLFDTSRWNGCTFFSRQPVELTCLLRPLADQRLVYPACNSVSWTNRRNTDTKRILKRPILDTNDSEFAKMIPEISLIPRPLSTAISTGSGKHSTLKISRKPRKQDWVYLFPFRPQFICSFKKQKEDNKWMELRNNKKQLPNVIISQHAITKLP